MQFSDCFLVYSQICATITIISLRTLKKVFFFDSALQHEDSVYQPGIKPMLPAMEAWIIFKNFYLFIFIFAVLGYCSCLGFSLVAVHGLLIVVASLLWSTGSRAHGLQ